VSENSMRISDEEQKYRDFDWHCGDADGRVGHFASSGFKRLPISVADSAEELSFLNDFFTQRVAVHHAHELDEHLTPECRTERYLHSFIAIADRGLFSFDESYLRPEICYFRVAIPTQALCLADLPDDVRGVLRRTTLSGYLLAQSSAIPYSATLEL
jgi:hypothetical protein